MTKDDNPPTSNSPSISCFVITYNRAKILSAVLKRVRWVDELVIIDKGGDNETMRVIEKEQEQRLDRINYQTQPFSPVVEQTRAYAQSLCTGDWTLCLDDDEILSPGAEKFFRYATTAEQDIYRIPIKNYILGRHFNTEFRHCFYRKGMVKYSPIVHSKPELLSDKIYSCEPDSAIFITHLSHPDVSSWIEKTNRYTNQTRHVENKTLEKSQQIQSYTEAVEQLKELYSTIDSLKIWEQNNLHNGEKEFERIVEQVLAED